MDKRDTKVTCPCCQSRLDVDVRTGSVVRWSRPEKLDETGKPVLAEEDWTSAVGRAQGRLSSAEDKFSSNLEREQNRERDLDDLFDKAKRKLEKRGEEDEEGPK